MGVFIAIVVGLVLVAIAYFFGRTRPRRNVKRRDYSGVNDELRNQRAIAQRERERIKRARSDIRSERETINVERKQLKSDRKIVGRDRRLLEILKSRLEK